MTLELNCGYTNTSDLFMSSSVVLSQSVRTCVFVVKQQSIKCPRATRIFTASSYTYRDSSNSGAFGLARFLSTNPDVSQKKEHTFRSEKVRDLFERITRTCSADDAKRIGAIINEMFGRPFRKHEFYHRGFGGVRVRGGGGKAAAAAGEAAQETEPAKTTRDLKLVSFDAKAKIKVIKEVRAIAGLGLKEAKELVEGAPATIQKDIKPEEAEELKTKLEAVGATIEVV